MACASRTNISGPSTPRASRSIVLTLAAAVGLAHAAPRTLAQEVPPPEPPATDTPAIVPAREKEPASVLPAPPSAPAANPDDTKAMESAENPDLARGHELFRRASEAMSRAKALTFHVKFHGVGEMLSKYSPVIEADVRMLRDPATNGWIVRATGRGTPKPGAAEMRFDVAWLASTVEWVDHEAKKVYEKRTREAKGQAVTIGASAKIQALIQTSPFTKEQGAESYVFEERRRIGGTDCDVVLATFAGRPGRNGTPGKPTRSRFAFGVNDSLPRLFEQITDGDMISGSMIHELDTLRADEASPPAMTPESMRVEVPEGYKEDRVPVVAPVVTASTTDPATGVVTTKVVPNGGSAPVVPEHPGSVGHTSPAHSPTTVRSAPARFDLPKAGGNATGSSGRITLESLAGKVVLLDFFGSWCLPCRETHEELKALLAEFKDKPVVCVAMNVREKNPDAAEEDIKRSGLVADIALGAESVAKQLGVKHYPSVAVLGPSGELLGVFGPWEKTKTIDAVKNAVNASLATLPASTDAAPKADGVPPPASNK